MRSYGFRVACALVVVVLAVGCGSWMGPRTTPLAPLPGTGSVAVLPFRVGGEIDPDAEFRERRDVPAASEDVGARMAATLSRDLATAGVVVADPAAVLRAMSPDASRYDKELAGRVAKAVGARFAVFGALTRYVDREGSAWGATVPATVWYQAVLIDAESGEVLLRDRFSLTQQPLSENVLELPRFLQGGGRWVTREEMLDGALGETAERLARVIRSGRAAGP